MRSLVAMFAAAVALVLAVPAAALAAGSISGNVTAASGGAAITGVEVCAWDTGGSEDFKCAETGADGTYSLTGLSAGSYKVEFWPFGGDYIFQYYDGKSTWSEATPVTVNDGADTPGIDAALAEGGRITGRVTDAISKVGIGGIVACAGLVGEEAGRCAEAGANGEYTIHGLVTGTYEVFFFDPGEEEGSGEYLPQTFRAGVRELVSVTAGATTFGVDAALTKAGGIAGTVSDSLSGAGIGASTVCLRQAAGGAIEDCVRTNGAGRYAIGGLAAGSYKVWFSPDVPAWEEEDDYFQQYFSGAGTFALATPVAVVPPAVTVGIDARLVSRKAPPVVPVPPAAVPVAKAKKQHCRKGLKRIRLKGKKRCVRIHRKRHRSGGGKHRDRRVGGPQFSFEGR
jgi:hypothetical protein